MDVETRYFIRELAKEHSWSFIDKIIYAKVPSTGRIVSIQCVAINPTLNFDAREYLTSNDTGECMYIEYSRIEYILQNPPCSEADIVSYETTHSLKLPELTRTFLTRVSSSLLDFNQKPKYALINGKTSFGYSVFDFDEVTIRYDSDSDSDYEDDEDMEKYRVINIFTERTPWLIMVIDGPHRGRIFDFRSSCGIGTTEHQVDFFLNGMTPTTNKHVSLSIMSYMFPGLKIIRTNMDGV